jgi:hypothetical protein
MQRTLTLDPNKHHRFTPTDWHPIVLLRENWAYLAVIDQEG